MAVEDTDAIFDTYAQDEEVARYVIGDRIVIGGKRKPISSARCDPTRGRGSYMLVGGEMSSGCLCVTPTRSHRPDCGSVLARRWWGQGLMTEALSEVALWALRQPSIFRIGAVCDLDNIAQPECWKNRGLCGKDTATLASPSKHQRPAARPL